MRHNFWFRAQNTTIFMLYRSRLVSRKRFDFFRFKFASQFCLILQMFVLPIKFVVEAYISYWCIEINAQVFILNEKQVDIRIPKR